MQEGVAGAGPAGLGGTPTTGFLAQDRRVIPLRMQVRRIRLTIAR
jgi:hypothetical protein